MGVATKANKRTLFVTFVNRTKRFEAYSSQFIADIRLIGYAYELLRYLGVEIWRFSWGNNYACVWL